MRSAQIPGMERIFDEMDAVRIHELAIRFAVEAADRSAKKYANALNDIRRDALFALSQDGVITHRAIGSLVESGWSGTTGSLLRTLFDIQIAAMAIVSSQKPRLMAFRYFYSGHRQLSRDHTRFDPPTRRAAREAIRERIKLLPEDDRQDALAFLKEKDRPYFFSEEWKSPSELVDLMAAPDLDRAYRQLSSAAHGGFLGIRLLRDDPDDLGIGPQLPPGEHAAGALLTSSRLLVELTSMRGQAEQLDLDEIASAMRHDIREVAGFAEK